MRFFSHICFFNEFAKKMSRNNSFSRFDGYSVGTKTTDMLIESQKKKTNKYLRRARSRCKIERSTYHTGTGHTYIKLTVTFQLARDEKLQRKSLKLDSRISMKKHRGRGRFRFTWVEVDKNSTYIWGIRIALIALRRMTKKNIETMLRTKQARKMNRYKICACCRYVYPRALPLFSASLLDSFISTSFDFLFGSSELSRKEKGKRERDPSILPICFYVGIHILMLQHERWAASWSTIKQRVSRRVSMQRTHAYTHILTSAARQTQVIRKHTDIRMLFFHVVVKQKWEANGDEKKNETHFKVASLVQSVWWSEYSDFPFE